MKVHIQIPYCPEKNLGRAYNQAMSNLPEGDWACFIDYDVMLLTPDAGKILHDYATLMTKNEDRSEILLTCWTNRIHPKAHMQLYTGEVQDNADVRTHIKEANDAKKYLYNVTRIRENISGFLMLIHKSMWEKQKFIEDGCLGVDTEYSKALKARGSKIFRMDGLYVWHTYRLEKGIKNKEHLQI